jgi:hypothetical protein
MEEAMWQVHEALLRHRRVRSTVRIAAEEELPRRWTELILRLNDLERSHQHGKALPTAPGVALTED